MATSDYGAIYDLAGLGVAVGRLASAVVATHPPGPSGRLLDLDCATGTAALVCADAGWGVVGVDPSAALLQRAEARARQVGLPIALAQADMAALPVGTDLLQPQTFDLVVCLSGGLNRLLTTDDVQQTGAAVARLLRPGGSFCCALTPAAVYATWDGHDGMRDAVLSDGADCLVYQRLSYDPTRQRACRRLVWFVQQNQRWWRSEVTTRERPWTDGELAEILADVGLQAGGCASVGAWQVATYVAASRPGTPG